MNVTCPLKKSRENALIHLLLFNYFSYVHKANKLTNNTSLKLKDDPWISRWIYMLIATRKRELIVVSKYFACQQGTNTNSQSTVTHYPLLQVIMLCTRSVVLSLRYPLIYVRFKGELCILFVPHNSGRPLFGACTLQVTKYQRQITMFLCMRLINRKGTILWTVYFSESNAHIDEME